MLFASLINRMRRLPWCAVFTSLNARNSIAAPLCKIALCGLTVYRLMYPENGGFAIISSKSRIAPAFNAGRLSAVTVTTLFFAPGLNSLASMISTCRMDTVLDDDVPPGLIV